MAIACLRLRQSLRAPLHRRLLGVLDAARARPLHSVARTVTVEPDAHGIAQGTIAEQPNAIVLVHSLWHRPEVFAPLQRHFAARGYASHAVGLSMLRRNGTSSTIESMVTELCSVPTGTPPVLVGHGFGVYVCLKYLESFAARGLAMLSPFPASVDDAYIAKLRAFDAAVTASQASGDLSQLARLCGVPSSPVPEWFADYASGLVSGLPAAAIEQYASEPPLFEAHTGLPMLCVGAVGDALGDRESVDGTRGRATRGNFVSELSERFGIADEWRVLLGSGKYDDDDEAVGGVACHAGGVLLAGPNLPRVMERLDGWLDACGL